VNLNSADLLAMKNAVRGARVVVSTHIHPDPDAIGSALAAREMLLQLGADPQVILGDEIPPRLKMLPGAGTIICYPQTPVHETFRVAMILDAGSLSRIGEVARLIAPEAVIVNIDHHFSTDDFGSINFVSQESAATAEMLFRICRDLNLTITPSLADNLYAGLLTDTGRFRYGNTTSSVMRMAADLIDAGADIFRVTDAMYYDIAPADVRSMGAVYSTLELFADGTISTLFARLDHLVEDPDTVVDMALSIRGVMVAVLISETWEGKIRVSLRSKSSVNVALIAEGFGGGGHKKASGFRMRGTLESVRERLLPVLIAAVDNFRLQASAEQA
jgi:phosphoesterase RecJ-like protein